MAEQLNRGAKEWVRKLKESLKPVKIIVIGEPGCGKSLLVNNLLQKNVAEVGDTLKPVTTRIARYEGQVEGFDAVVYDTPGMEGGDGSSEAIRALREVIDRYHTVVVVCLRMTEKKTNRPLVHVLEELDVNKSHTIVALTFADTVSSMSKSEKNKDKYFFDMLKSWRERIKKEFWSSLTAYPTASDRSKLLPTGDAFTPLCTAIMQTFSMRLVCSYRGGQEGECTFICNYTVTDIKWDQDGEWASGTVDGDQVGLFHPLFVEPYDAEVEKLREKDKYPLNRPPPEGHEATYENKALILINKPEDWYSCRICFSLAISPVQTSCCGHTFCRKCCDKWSESKDTCPQCRDEDFDVSDDVRAGRFIKNLKLYCSHHTLGCDWTGELRQLYSHLEKDCQFTIVKCCKEKCKKKYRRFFHKVHTEHDCLWRRVACPFCRAASGNEVPIQLMTYDELEGVHLSKCPHYPIRCPNLCPDRHWTRGTIREHLKECPKQVIACDFKEFGCSKCTEREKMPTHLKEDMQQHLSMLLVSHHSLLNSHRSLEERIAKLEQNPSK